LGFFEFKIMYVYNKPFLSIEDQLNLLIQKGMIIPDIETAKHHLKHIKKM